jgi:hypothetical protein
MNLNNACTTSPTSKKSSSINLKLISGGQTGVDRAALDFALAHHIPCGGMCPSERKAEDGAIPERYPLEEAQSADYRYRTRQNVLQSHGTLIIYHQRMGKGTQLTLDICRAKKKPSLVIDADGIEIEAAALELWEFTQNHFIAILNVAGPRASTWPEGHSFVFRLFEKYFKINS